MPCGGIVITNSMNITVHGKHSVQAGSAVPPRVPKGGRVRFRHELTLNLAPGEYTFDLGFSHISSDDHARAHELSHAELEQKLVRCCQVQRAGSFQIIPKRQGMELPFFGMCDLPGSSRVAVAPPPSAAKHT